jgi:hydroxymethylbilane synthase
MKRLEGGCQIPVGALAMLDDGEILLEAMVADLDGTMMVRSSLTGPDRDPEGLGLRLAERMIAEGAGKILEKVRQEFDINDVR